MPLVGFSMGGSAIVGQSLGAENIDRSKKTAAYSSIISGIVMLIFAVMAFILGENIISIFNNTPEIIFYGAQFLQFGSLGLSFLGFAFGFTIVFSGSGYNIPFVVGSAISRWAIQVPILLITILWLKLDVAWVWLSFVFSDVCEGIVYFIFYKKGKWKTKRVR
jgi:Na+-driven multidrug efflux pump